jgi:hypothetical protein
MDCAFNETLGAVTGAPATTIGRDQGRTRVSEGRGGDDRAWQGQGRSVGGSCVTDGCHR